MKIFVDTSAFIAWLDKSQTQHNDAKKIWGKIIENKDTLFTSNYVILESIALMQNRFGIEAVYELQETMLPLINIEWVDDIIHRTATSALLTASKRDLSLVDCVSFEIMRNLGIETAFTFDTHFKQHGFKCIQ